ncbi:MAG: purine-nucleoside phosphorylase [Verrucomicrobiales bacterium]
MDKTTYNLALEACLKRLESSQLGFEPSIALVMGSGFQSLLEKFPVEHEIPYEDLAGFPRIGVKGHCSKIAVANIAGTRLLILCGRAHYYEGYSMEEITFPIRALASAGIKDILLTNAAGGINPKFAPGDFMLFTDHINFMGANPLRGQMNMFGDCFLDLATIYKSCLNRLLLESAQKAGLLLHQGVYAAISGPIYETPAEIRAFAILGADAVGMSTVPEAIVAHHCGMKVAALSCITNLAAGLHPAKISHQEVLDQSSLCAEKAMKLIEIFAARYQSAQSGSSLTEHAPETRGACSSALESVK